MRGTGSFEDPIIAMSSDLEQIKRDIRASLTVWDKIDDGYWYEKESKPAEFSNGLWHLGHNRYWEVRMRPDNTGSADPNLGRLSAIDVYVPEIPSPTVPTLPPTLPPTPSIPDDNRFKLILLRLNDLSLAYDQITEDLTEIKRAQVKGLTGKIPYLGTVNLKPPQEQS